MNNEDVLKVFHAGGQDLEIIHNLTGKVPYPLFDTQIAAMALGHGEQIGYSNLIEILLGHSLDKGARFTDWSRRPLDKRQIDYAIADVTHLATIFPRMVEKLKKTGRGAWLDEEMERLADPSSFAFAARRRVEAAQAAEPQSGGARPAEGARGMARDRGAVEEPAARADHQGRHAERDRAPSAQDPGRPRPRPRAFRRLEEQRHRRAADRARSQRPSRSSPDEMPDREPKRPGLTKDGALVSDLLKLLLKIRAKESGVAARLIARSDDLEALAAGVRKDLNILSGWRYEQFGKDALDLVEGRLAFAIENGKLKMSRVVDEEEPRRCVRLLWLVPAPARRLRDGIAAAESRSTARLRATTARPTGPTQFIGQPGTSETGAAIMRATNAAVAALGAARA